MKKKKVLKHWSQVVKEPGRQSNLTQVKMKRRHLPEYNKAHYFANVGWLIEFLPIGFEVPWQRAEWHLPEWHYKSDTKQNDTHHSAIK